MNFWVVGWKFTKFLMSYLKPQVNFSLKFASLFNVMGDRLLTAQVKFHQMCTLIGYFCWKYIKFQLKKVWRKYVSRYQRVVQSLKKNLFFVSKMTRILIRALNCLKNLHFDWSLLCKVYNVSPKKIQRSYIS